MLCHTLVEKHWCNMLYSKQRQSKMFALRTTQWVISRTTFSWWQFWLFVLLISSIYWITRNYRSNREKVLFVSRGKKIRETRKNSSKFCCCCCCCCCCCYVRYRLNFFVGKRQQTHTTYTMTQSYKTYKSTYFEIAKRIKFT